MPRRDLEELISDAHIALGRGKVISKLDISASPGPYPIYSSARLNDGKFGEYGSYMFDEELITWSIDGGGRFFYRPKHKFSVTNVGGTLRVLKREAIDYRYLYYALSSQHARLQFDWASKAHPSVIRRLYKQIPLPSLPEQRRIAAILDKADALRAKRREAIAKLDQLLQSVFLDMFGDPVANPNGWPVLKVGEVFSNFVGGKNVECPDQSSSHYRILKVSAVTSKVYRPEQSKPAPEGFLPAVEAVVEKGDLLFSRANTTELVAATAYVWDTPDNMVLPDKLWKMRISPNTHVNALYLWELFKNVSFRHELSKLSSGTSGSMKNISKSKLVRLPMPLPPLPLQKHFARSTEHVERQKRRLHIQAEQQERLFTALQHHAFAGTL